MTPARLSGIGPYVSLVRMDVWASWWPERAEEPVDWQGGRLTVGVAERHQPVSSWALPPWCGLLLWPEARASEDDWRRLAHANVAGAKAERDAAALALLLLHLHNGDWDGLAAARLHSGKDEVLGRLTPAFFPLRHAGLELGAGLVTFCQPAGGLLLLARDNTHRSALRDAALVVLAAHNQSADVAELSFVPSPLSQTTPGTT